MDDAQRDMKRGFAWLGSAAALARAIDLFALLFALRALDDTDVGRASIAWTIAVLIEAWNGGGVGAAVLNARRVTPRLLDTAFWTAASVGALLSVIAALCAPVVAHVYDEPTLAPLVAVSGLKLLAVSVASVPLQRLGRALRFDAIAKVQIAASLGAAVLRVALAHAGAGAWALVAAHTAHGALQLGAVVLVARPRPRLRFDAATARALLGFGAKTCGADALVQLARNVDYLLVGHFLGVGAVGLYRVIFEMAMEPMMAISDVIARTGARVLCRLRPSDPELARTFLWTLERLALVLLPVAFVLALAFEPMMTVLGRAPGEGVAFVARVLVVAAYARALLHLFPMLATALGRPDAALRMAALTLVWLVVAISVGLSVAASAGLAPVALAWLGSAFVVLPVALVVARRLAGMEGVAIGRVMLRPASAGLLLAMVALVVVTGLGR